MRKPKEKYLVKNLQNEIKTNLLKFLPFEHANEQKEIKI